MSARRFSFARVSYSGPRALQLTQAPLPLLLSGRRPSDSDSLSMRLFHANLDLAQEAYETDYLQNMMKGVLSPDIYGQYSVQDVAYCNTGLADWESLRDRTTDTTVKEFASARVKSWEGYISSTYADWHITDPSAIKLSDAAQQYVDYESKVCREYDPIYAAIVMAPCDRLWYWVSNQMKSNSPNGNVYQKWIDDNSSYEQGALELETFIDANMAMIDEEKASVVYRTAMLAEVNFFRSACKQPLLAHNHKEEM